MNIVQFWVIACWYFFIIIFMGEVAMSYMREHVRSNIGRSRTDALISSIAILVVTTMMTIIFIIGITGMGSPGSPIVVE
jgi:phosphatidylglycerophosphate synthase